MIYFIYSKILIFFKFQKYCLTSSHLAHEVNWLDKLKQLREDLDPSLSPMSIFRFLDSELINSEVSLTKFESEKTSSRNFQSENVLVEQFYKISSKDMIIIDLLISLPFEEECISSLYDRLLSNYNSTSNKCAKLGYMNFLKNVMECIRIRENLFDSRVTIPELLENEIYSLKSIEYEGRLEKISNLMALINSKTAIEENSSKLQLNYSSEVVRYISNIEYLLETFSAKSETQLNDILSLNTDKTICKLIYEDNVDPENLADCMKNIKTNLSYVLALGCTDKVNQEKPEIVNQTKFYGANRNALSSIKKDSFLVAYLLKEICEFEYQSLSFNSPIILDTIRDFKKFQDISVFYNNRNMVSYLNYDFVDINELEKFIKCNTMKFETKSALLAAISPMQYKRHKTQIDQLRHDILLQYLEQETNVDQNLVFIHLRNVSNIDAKYKLVIENLHRISDITKAQLLIEDLLHSNLEASIKIDLASWIKRLKIYKTIIDAFEDSSYTWVDIQQMSENSPETILHLILIKKQMQKLAYEWIQMHPLIEVTDKIAEVFLNALNSTTFNEASEVTIFRVIETYLGSSVFEFYKSILPDVRKLHALEYILNFLDEDMQSYQISLEILKTVSYIDDHFWNLLPFPLILIEELLMNMKIENLSKILNTITPLLKNVKCPVCFKLYDRSLSGSDFIKWNENIFFNVNTHEEFEITMDCIDLLLRIYASKSLQFKVMDNIAASYSMSTLTLDSCNSQIFQMPQTIPTKEQWVPDNEAVVCMVCKVNKFTLLNRRHHCRRCGT